MSALDSSGPGFGPTPSFRPGARVSRQEPPGAALRPARRLGFLLEPRDSLGEAMRPK